MAACAPESICRASGDAAEAAIECPACAAPRACHAFDKEGYALAQCAECGFLFVQPYPSAAELDAHYRTAYRGVGADFYPKAGSRRRRALVRSLRFLRHVRRKDVVDIGCGGGFMVHAFTRLGARAVGIDASANSIAYAQRAFPGDKFYCETLSAFAARGHKFDFIFLSEVFEHLAGTREVMAAITAIAKPRSLVYVSTPDLSHPLVPADIREWQEIAPPEHLQFFTRAALLALFERYGFRLYREFPHKTPAHDRLFVRSG